MTIRFAHILNTVAPEENKELASVQELTFRSMIEALKWTAGQPHVEHLSAQFHNARSFLPKEIRPTSDLISNAADVGALRTNKRLPLISEILSRLNESQNATHFIYTNADICVMPYFYAACAKYIEAGHDAFVINRRRLKMKFLNADLPETYAEAGKKHIGYDCFVFARPLLEKFVKTEIYISAPPAGGDIFHNVFTFADNPVLFTEKHLTFHIGMELVKPWGESLLNAHNEREFSKLLKTLKPHMNIAKFPGAGYNFLSRHFKWLMNPTLHYPTMASLDFAQLSVKRKPSSQEVDGGIAPGYHEWIFGKAGFRDGE